MAAGSPGTKQDPSLIAVEETMDTYDFDDTPHSTRSNSGMVWNILTILVLLGTVCMAGVFALILVNPYTSINPFPPPTLPAALTFPTATPTLSLSLPATWTPVPTVEPTATSTPRPTATLPPTETPFSLVTPADTPTSEAAKGGMPFLVQKGQPLAITNIYHPDLACNWIGVGGQVFDMKGSAITGLQVQLGGVLNGSPIPEGSRPTLTGLLPNVPGYYEFALGDKPFASTQKLWVQLVDQSGSLALSDKVYFDTFDSCEKNLIIINFRQVR
jgi:hypothetical protein